MHLKCCIDAAYGMRCAQRMPNAPRTDVPKTVYFLHQEVIPPNDRVAIEGLKLFSCNEDDSSWTRMESVSQYTVYSKAAIDDQCYTAVTKIISLTRDMLS